MHQDSCSGQNPQSLAECNFSSSPAAEQVQRESLSLWARRTGCPQSCTYTTQSLLLLLQSWAWQSPWSVLSAWLGSCRGYHAAKGDRLLRYYLLSRGIWRLWHGGTDQTEFLVLPWLVYYVREAECPQIIIIIIVVIKEYCAFNLYSSFLSIVWYE